MGLKGRRTKRAQARQAATRSSEFLHSSGRANLEAVLGDHTLDENAEPTAPKGYRARSIAKTETEKRT